MKKLITSLVALVFFVSLSFADVVSFGAKVTLSATSDGAPSPTFKWFRNGVEVANGAIFIISSFSVDTAGEYFVRASNIAGSADSERLTLTIASAPTKPVIKSEVVYSVTAKNSLQK